MRSAPPPGLCAHCSWVRRVGNRRGSEFFMCGRAATDPSFRRYPALPVLRCRGFEPAEPAEASGTDDT